MPKYRKSDEDATSSGESIDITNPGITYHPKVLSKGEKKRIREKYRNTSTSSTYDYSYSYSYDDYSSYSSIPKQRRKKNAWDKN